MSVRYTPESMPHILNRLRYKHLMMVALLGERGNLHQVAEVMNMSQPAASRMLQEIEQTFGHMLFDRTPRGVHPTAAGEMLIDFAQSALNRLDRCAESLHRYQLGDQGQLLLGAIMGAAPDLVAKAVVEIKRQRPMLQVRMLGETSDQLVELLGQSRIDIAIARYVTALEHNLFDFEALGNERMLAVVRAEHPLAQTIATPLKLDELLESWSWILQPLKTPARQVLEKEFELAGLMTPRDIIECGSIFASLQLVQHSDAILVMSEAVLKESIALGRVVPLPLSLGQTLPPYGILTRKNELLTESAQHFCRILRQIAHSERAAQHLGD